MKISINILCIGLFLITNAAFAQKSKDTPRPNNPKKQYHTTSFTWDFGKLGNTFNNKGIDLTGTANVRIHPKSRFYARLGAAYATFKHDRILNNLENMKFTSYALKPGIAYYLPLRPASRKDDKGSQFIFAASYIHSNSKFTGNATIINNSSNDQRIVPIKETFKHRGIDLETGMDIYILPHLYFTHTFNYLIYSSKRNSQIIDSRNVLDYPYAAGIGRLSRFKMNLGLTVKF